MKRKKLFLVPASIALIFCWALPNAWACKVMGEETRKRASADQICSRQCGFFGGWSGRVDDHRKNLGVHYVDCYCNGEPQNGLCQ